MSDEQGAAGAAAIAAAGGGGGGDESGAGGGGASWRDSLPDDIKADPSIANFADVAALAKGYRDTKAALTARPEPIDFKTDAGLKAFADAWRPAAATDYDIPLREGDTNTALADAFKGFAHETGMPPAWAKGAAEFFNTQAQAAIDASEAASAKEVETLKAQIGAAKFETNLNRVKAMLPKLGVQLEDGDLARLDAKIGSGNLLNFMFHIADTIGEPEPIEGGAGGDMGGSALTPEAAKARQTELMKDKEWRTKAAIAGSAEASEAKRLQGIIAAGRSAKKPT